MPARFPRPQILAAMRFDAFRRITLLIAPLATIALIASACSTAGGELAESGVSDTIDEIAFDEGAREQPVTEPDTSDPVETFDSDVAGPAFPVAEPGPTLAAAGDDGVWWFDANGSSHLVVEETDAADYDGGGGLVFQRSGSSTIVRRSADAVETNVVKAADGETLDLLGVAVVAGSDHVIYLRTTGEDTTLERATLDEGVATAIAPVSRDGTAPERLSLSGGYITGLYRTGSGAGWASISLSSGAKLFGTTTADLGRCAEVTAGCAEAVTTNALGDTIYQVAVTDSGGLALVVNSANNFAEIARVDLQRPENGWHPSRIAATDGLVIVSRTIAADGSGSLPALIVDPSNGTITQLAHVGDTVIVAP